MKYFSFTVIASLILTALVFTARAGDISQDDALRLRQQGQILPLEEVLKPTMQRYPGARLLELELEEDDGIYIYEIELITRKGVVRELEIDALTGQILEDEEDD